MDLLYKYIITIFRRITWNNHPLTNYFRVPKEWGPKGFDPLGARHFLHGTFAILLMPCLGLSAKDWENYGEFIETDWFKSISAAFPNFFDSISWKIHFNPFETGFFSIFLDFSPAFSTQNSPVLRWFHRWPRWHLRLGLGTGSEARQDQAQELRSLGRHEPFQVSGVIHICI